MKRYHPTLRAAKKAFKDAYGFDYKDSPVGYPVLIHDTKKTYPKRTAKRFFIGTRLEWLNQ